MDSEQKPTNPKFNTDGHHTSDIQTQKTKHHLNIMT